MYSRPKSFKSHNSADGRLGDNRWVCQITANQRRTFTVNHRSSLQISVENSNHRTQLTRTLKPGPKSNPILNPIRNTKPNHRIW